jgi:TPP-dependent pyruvate/acetoin dehydrogenase alpha subunit
MWVFDRWSPYSYQNNREKYKDDEEKREFNLKECLWFCMTSLTPQVISRLAVSKIEKEEQRVRGNKWGCSRYMLNI